MTKKNILAYKDIKEFLVCQIDIFNNCYKETESEHIKGRRFVLKILLELMKALEEDINV